MASGARGPIEAEIRTLFEAGTVVGRSDGELLDRFLAAGEPTAEPAFAALVERHGPMVWRVCREVLREANDADDAFQATFVVLARRAATIRKHSSLGPWLYGVALRIARCARRRAARRRSRERVAAEQEREGPVSDGDRLDQAPIIHEEVGRLAEKYRAPLVLCYFEGLTHDQAASLLGWPVGTVRSRLAEARDRLRPRLLRRGVAPTVAILAATGRAEATATVPAALVATTVGLAVGVGTGTAGVVPAAVSALVGTVLRGMNLMKLSVIATGLVAAAVAGTAGVAVVAARPQNAEEPVNTKPAAPPPSPGARTGDTPKANNPAPTGYSPTASEPSRDRRNATAPDVRSGASSPRVLWAKLNSAVQNLELAKAAHQSARAGFGPVLAAQGEIESLTAELGTVADDLRDEVDLLEAQLDIRKADVEAARAHLAKVKVSHANTKKLFDDKVVSSTEVETSLSEVDIRTAELAKKLAEFNEVVLRIKQATRRRDEAIALAARAKTLTTTTSPSPATSAARP